MEKNDFDIIIVGAGATGSGIALDAASRGFNILLLEKNDFAEGTSSRSTKLVHGGVRYLEAAVKKLDKNQFNLVKEALKERYRLLKNAPHLCSKLKLVTPIYKWWQLPYMFIGLTLYDLIAGTKGIGRSSIVFRKTLIKNFPNIKKKGLIGGVKYYDGSFNDSRLNISLIKTAQEYGATCKNYHEVKEFIYTNEKISGVVVEDTINKQQYTYKSPLVINATGIFSDKIRLLDNTKAKKLLEVSSGVHIILDKKYLPNNEGLMIPKTQDGRVLFILPWMGKCLVGTTDEKTQISEHPKVEEKDIDYILKHLEIYFDLKVERKDILSSWCGIRPLVAQNEHTNSSNIVREHLIVKSESNLVSILGGKWTSYRKMAKETLDFCIENNFLEKKECITKKLKLKGSKNLNKNCQFPDIEEDIKNYLISMYGDCAIKVLNSVNNIKRLHKDYPYINAEIIYTIEEEFVQKPLDFLIRRTNLALIDKQAAKMILEEVIEIMSKKLLWSEDLIKNRRDEALNLLNSYI